MPADGHIMDQNTNSRFSARALSDFKLIDLAIGGDEKAYTKLLTLYRRSVYHMILRMVRDADDAEDLTIESFAKAFRNLHRFKRDFTFSTWLFRVASNNTIDFLRKKRLNTFSIDTRYTNEDGAVSGSFELEDSGLSPQDGAIKAEKEELVREIVDTLPPKYSRLLKMRYFDQLSYEEISEELHTPLGTIKAQLHRARSLMYNIIKDKKAYI